MFTEKVFFEPKLEGHRFDDHTLPLNILEDFSAFEELVFELAKKSYLDKNSHRKRVPKGFTDNVHLKLSNIDEGSTIPKILIAVITSLSTPTIPVPNTEYFSYFEQARDKVFELVENANSGKSIDIDSKFLNYFNRIGKNLEEGETIDFLNIPSSNRNLKFSRNTRRRILLSRGEKLEYSEIIQENVFISSIDKKNKIFQVELKGESYQHPVVEDFNETISLAFQEYENKALVSIKATGVFNKDNKLILIEDIQSMDILDPFDISVRLNDLLQLKERWFDERDGKALNKENTILFEKYFNSYYNSNLKLPVIFPTLNGDIVLEWKKSNVEISIEINLSNFEAELFFFDMEDDSQDHQTKFDLKKSNDWAIINNLISNNIN